MGDAADPVIHLLRHGETERGARYWGRTDVALSAEGWRQMGSAVEGGGPWRAIVSSPLARCRAFAERLAGKIAVPLSLDARLMELDFGEWEGRTATELMGSSPEALTRFWEDPLAHPPPGGERLEAFARRVLAAWQEIGARDEPMLVITHGGPIRVILAHVSGRPLTRLHNIPVPLAALVAVCAGSRV